MNLSKTTNSLKSKRRSPTPRSYRQRGDQKSLTKSNSLSKFDEKFPDQRRERLLSTQLRHMWPSPGGERESKKQLAALRILGTEEEKFDF